MTLEEHVKNLERRLSRAEPLLEALARYHDNEVNDAAFVMGAKYASRKYLRSVEQDAVTPGKWHHMRVQKAEGTTADLAGLSQDAEARPQQTYCRACGRTTGDPSTPRCACCYQAIEPSPPPKRDAVEQNAMWHIEEAYQATGPLGKTYVIAHLNQAREALLSERAAVAKREKEVAEVAKEMEECFIARDASGLIRQATEGMVRGWHYRLSRPVERSEGEDA